MMTIPRISLADTIFITKDQPAPFSGFLFDEASAKKTRIELLNKDFLKETNESLNRSLNLSVQNSEYKDKQINILLEQNDKLAKANSSQRSANFWENSLYFLAGVGITGFIAYGLQKVSGN
jgi:hypothetical protein